MKFKELEEFDYLMRIDDDSWFKNKIEFSLFDELDKQKDILGLHIQIINGFWQLNTIIYLNGSCIKSKN